MNHLSWFTAVIFVAAYLSGIRAGGCSVGVSYAPRAYTWVSGGLTYKTYDVTIFNNGSCDTSGIIFLSLTLDNPADQVSQFWNLFQQDPTHFAYISPNSIFASSAATVGFVISYEAPSEGVVTVNLLYADCSETGSECVGGSQIGEYSSCSDLVCTAAYPYVCISDGGLPRCVSESQSSSSSSSSGAAAASSSSSSSTTTSTSTTSSSQCLVAVSITARSTPGSSWVTGTTPFQIYDILVTNAGTCNVFGVQLVFNLAAGSSISSTWNLDPSSYILENFGEQILPGASYGGAGLVVEGGGSISVSAGGTTCSC